MQRGNGPDGWTGVLTDGQYGGANWTDVWETFVAPPNGGKLVVQDVLGPGVYLNATAHEPRGYLPRPCIIDGLNLGNYCGWPLGFNTSLLPWNSMWNQTLYTSVLPGLPPSGPQDTCYEQTCPGFAPCNATAPIDPMPNPCNITGQ